MGLARPGTTGPSRPPPARGVRLDWLDIPPRVRAAVESWLGSTVVTAVSQPTGFSPGVAARLQTSDGRRVFAKAVGPTPNPDSPSFHRREAHILAGLATVVSVPRLLWSYDEGDAGWVLLVFEDVGGWHPAQPWRLDELNRVTNALVGLAAALTRRHCPRLVSAPRTTGSARHSAAGDDSWTSNRPASTSWMRGRPDIWRH